MALQFLLWLILLFSLSAHGSNLFYVDDQLSQANLGPKLRYYRDTSEQFSIKSLRANSQQIVWLNNQQEILNLGFDQASYWIWVELENIETATQHLLLDIGYPSLDNIWVYSVSDSGDMLQWHTGDIFTHEHRPIEHRNFIFPLTLESLEKTQLYIHVQTAGTVQVPITLWSEEAFYENIQGSYLIHGIFFGIFLVMIVYNFFLYLSMKESSYIYYVVFASSFLFFFLSLSGFGFQYIWPASHIFQQYSILIFISLAMFALSGFTLKFLRITKTEKTAFWCLTSIEIISVLNLFLCLVLAYEHVIKIQMFTTLYMSIVCIAIGILSWNKIGDGAKYYTAAWITMALGVILLASNKLGYIESNFFTEYCAPASAAIQSLLLSFALANRIRQEQKNRVIAEQKVLNSQQELLRARLKESNAFIESEQVRIRSLAESEAKTEFLAMMSHEIRTPLNGIMGMSELLKSTQLDDIQNRFVHTIYSSGESLLTIINDILDFSKIQAGKLSIESIPINLFELLEDCTSLFDQACTKKGLLFSAVINPMQPVMIQSDPVRLRQVILNFVSNAIKFTEQGEVCITLDIDHTHETLCISVKDSGIGITDEQKEMLFSAFSQADRSTTRKFGGTGLGLAICKKLSELMQGETGVTSKLGEGSTFWFKCKINILEDNHEQPLSLAKKVIATYQLPEFERTVLAKHIDNWGGKLIDIEPDLTAQVNVPSVDLDYLFIDKHFYEQVKGSLFTSQYRITDANIITVGNFDENARLRKPLCTANIYACLAPDKQKSNEEINANHDDFPLNGLHVLVAEDNAVNQIVIKAMLSKLGAEVTIYENGQLVFDALTTQSNNYDVILMDCEMPVMDGFMATKTIREFEHTQHCAPIPIIALTAHAMDNHRKMAKDVGMNGFVTKPVKKMELIQAISDSIHFN